MENLLPYTMFQKVLFPEKIASDNNESPKFFLQRKKILNVSPEASVWNYPLVIFDFETTGLSATHDKIIEMGAIRFENFKEVRHISTLIDPEMALKPEITRITGITNEDLKGQPNINTVLPEFLNFIDGAILVAHNAEFDMGFLRKCCLEIGLILDWPVLCTLKMARTLLTDLESKSLDRLAQHYQLTFEARHRSIGDVRVTAQVLEKMLADKGSKISSWRDVTPFRVI